jgi:mRNA interferase MazF
LSGVDVILCQITSQSSRDPDAIELLDRDFVEGGLRQASFIRPNRLFTADSAIVLYRAGRISPIKQAAVAAALVALFQV